jgi:hypothetical protein
MTDREWLDGLKPGDEVAVDVGAGMGCRWHLVTVARRTPTLIVCAYPGCRRDSEAKYRAEDGRATARDRWNRRRLEPLTNEIRAAVQRESDLAAVRYVNWEELPPATLRAICDLLKARG